MDERASIKQRIILTGATGFIGTHIQRQLLESGFDVIALIRPESAHWQNILPGVEVRKVALDAAADIAQIVADADAIVYCAGTVRGRQLSDFQPANIDGVATLAKAAAAKPVAARFILVSSLAASRPHLSDYAQSKYLGECTVQSTANLEWVIIRPPAVYGPGDREMRPLLLSIRRGLALVVGPAEQRLSLLFAYDLARAIAAVIARFSHCSGRIFELDDGFPGGYTWADIVAEARGSMPVLTLSVPRSVLTLLARLNLRASQALGFSPMLTPGKVRELSQPAWVCNNHALTAATGWLPQTRLRDGVAATFNQSAK